MGKVKISPWMLFLFCFYTNPVMFNGFTTISYLYIYGIPIIYLFRNFKFISRITIFQGKITAIIVLLIYMSYLYPTLHQTYDFSYVRVIAYTMRKLPIYCFLIILLMKKHKNNFSMEQFMYYYALAQAFYVIGTILLISIPALKRLWFSLFQEIIESEVYLSSYGYTFRIGWQGFSGFSHTIDSTFGCIFSLYLYYGTEIKKRIQPIQFWMIYILCFIGNMFYGRSGLVVTIVSSIIAVSVWNRMKFTKILSYILIIILGLIALFNLKDIPFFSTWFYWMSSPIINLITTGSFNNASIQATSAGIRFPDINTFLLGDGYFSVHGGYYMSTDSGIMRNLYFWGVLGTGLAYGITIGAISIAKRKSILLFILMLFTFVAFEYKGIIYYDYLTKFLALSYCDSLRMKYGNLYGGMAA